MRTDRISAWTLAVVVAAAAATKLVRLEATERDVGALLTAAGIGAPPGGGTEAAIWGVAAVEFVLAVLVALGRATRVGLVSIVALLAAGILVMGSATSWGRDAGVACPCGLPLEVPFLRNTFAAMLVRDAFLVALVALAWGPSAPRGALAGISADPQTGRRVAG